MPGSCRMKFWFRFCFFFPVVSVGFSYSGPITTNISAIPWTNVYLTLAHDSPDRKTCLPSDSQNTTSPREALPFQSVLDCPLQQALWPQHILPVIPLAWKRSFGDHSSQGHQSFGFERPIFLKQTIKLCGHLIVIFLFVKNGHRRTTNLQVMEVAA